MLICQRHETILRLLSSAATASIQWRVREIYCLTTYVYSFPPCSRQALHLLYIFKDEMYEIFLVVTLKINVFQGVVSCSVVSHLERPKH